MDFKPWSRKDARDSDIVANDKSQRVVKNGEAQVVVTTYVVKESKSDQDGVRIERGGDAPILKSPSGSFDW